MHRGLDCRSGFYSKHTLTAFGSSDGKKVKDVFGCPGARIGVDSTHGVVCLVAGINLKTVHLSRQLYSWNITECDVKPQPTNQPTKKECQTLKTFRFHFLYCLSGTFVSTPGKLWASLQDMGNKYNLLTVVWHWYFSLDMSVVAF